MTEITHDALVEEARATAKWLRTLRPGMLNKEGYRTIADLIDALAALRAGSGDSEPTTRQCNSRVGGIDGLQCEHKEGHIEKLHQNHTTQWNDPPKLCWSGPTYSHGAHRWTEDTPGGKTYWCHGAATDRT